MPDEPSVLDYLKSKLKFRGGREKIEIPDGPGLSQDVSGVGSRERVLESVELQNEPVQQVEPPSEKPVKNSRWPWRSLLAMAIALLAQRSWEPSPDQTATIGLILYALSLVLLIWAVFMHEWSLAPVPETGSASDALQVRRLPFILGILLTLAAFITLGHNLFTFWNVTLWLLAAACLVWAFWLPGQNVASPWKRVQAFFARPAWQFKITRWTLLVLAVAAVVAFFRIYNLTGVPSEPNSDHAEKILDIFDITQGQPRIFFPRNTGREGIQMYLTLLVSKVFGTGLSFPSLKIGTVLCGLATLPFLYLLGREYGGKRIGLLAVFFAGIAYWPNVISRFGLRFPLYPLFAAPTLYFLIRGLRTRDRNQFILSGLFLGFGLHGYTPFRIVPFIVVAAVGLYLLHSQSRGNRKQAIAGLVILAFISFIVFLPLARFWLENPADFAYRAFTRLGPTERPLPGPAFQLFLTNIWNAVRMFNWKDGETWAHSVVFRPALDVVSGALFLIGVVLVLVRYFRERHWQDLFLLLAVPLLQLPSILSLAFPNENPDLARAGASFVPAFLFVALALDGLVTGIQAVMSRRLGTALAWVLVLFLAAWSSFQNYDLAFRQYADRYTASTWNSSEMGTVIKQFRQVYGTSDSVWIVAYPHWVDTRLPGIWAGIPNRDFAIWPQDFEKTLEFKGNKLFMIKADDPQDLDLLRQLYPQGVLSTFHSATNLEGKDFLILFVPSNE